MKTKLLLIYCLLMASMLWAQEEREGAKTILASQTIQNGETTINGNPATMQFQVGLPFIVQDAVTIDPLFPEPYYAYINFPWNILYLYETFSEETSAFDVSKGYFGDKVLVRWELKSNYDIINNIKIYRRKYTEANTSAWIFLSNVSKDVTQYEDLYIS